MLNMAKIMLNATQKIDFLSPVLSREQQKDLRDTKVC